MPNLRCIRELGFPLYFEKVGLAGGICASFAHTVLVPLDVLKTRIQISPEKYNSIVTAFRVIAKEEGSIKLFTGLTPTLFGYFAQGFMKFGLYEAIKYGQYRAFGATSEPSFIKYVVASSMAEVIATVCLCPFEAVRVRSLVQPIPPSQIIKQLASEHRNPLVPFYRGIFPILAKQVPYTATQLSVFSLAIPHFYSLLFPSTPKEQLSKSNQLMATVSCGIFAGAVASIVSHPADTIFTQINSSNQTMLQVIRRIGIRGMWVGVGTRCLMTSLLSGVMFLVYDSVRLMVKLPTS